ncbi:MAG: FHA domain-containing protein, partial [Deltaproteobacteria bacterium]|nr:FHA domain-containing protein [Deltaproteobacteria bacterium]
APATAPAPAAAPSQAEAPATAPAPAAAPSQAAAPAAAAAPATAPEQAAGAAAAPAQAACPSCGTAIKPDDAFCASCGHNLKEAPKGGSTMFMHTASPDAEVKKRARLVLIKPDGSEGTVFTLAEKTTIGRSQGTIMFPKDPYISPRHAELQYADGKLRILDLTSLNGVYRRMTGQEPIVPGTYFRIGRQLLRLEVPGEFQPLQFKKAEGDDATFWGSPPPQIWARLVQVLEGGKIGEIHLLSLAEVTIGREDGSVRFPEDGFISSRHCMLLNRDGDCMLRDLDSSNGTYLRIQGHHDLAEGDRIQIGNQVLRVEID